jgi:SAM-dependent methyltransferase
MCDDLWMSAERPDLLADPAELAALAARWRDALESWAIPPEILAQAPALPWVHPPKMFRMGDEVGAPATPSFVAALAALGDGGAVLDVGCGGGRSSLPLAPPATSVAGVDESPEMLNQFSVAAAARGVRHSTHLGMWPSIGASVPAADVVVCHHVAYNVAEIVPFLEALTAHARRRVVVELPAHHPVSPLNPLWKRFWDIDRPTEPSAELFVEIVTAAGWAPTAEAFTRPERPSAMDRAEYVAFVRQRLCLPASRDPEVDEALGDDPRLSEDVVWTVSWDGVPPSPDVRRRAR